MVVTPPADEASLLQGLQTGSEDAFRSLVERYQEQVLNTCLGFVPNRQDAEDISQEVFIEVFRAVKNFRGESSIATWLYRLSVNQSLQWLRYRKRKKRLAFFQSLIGLESPAALRVPDPVDHPGIALEQREQTAILYQHLESLPENQRAALTLHKIDQLSHAAIADILHLSIPAVESLIHRAKKSMQQRLAGR